MPAARDRAEVEPEEDDAVPEPWVPAWRPVAAFVLALCGFGISMYLTLDHFSGVLPICSSSGFINCGAVTTSTYSYVFHVPVSLLGLLFYTAAVVVNWPPLWRVRAPVVVWGRLAMMVAGIGFVLYLLAAELFSIKAICVWCTGVHIITFVIFVLVVMSFPAMSAGGAAWEEWDETDDVGEDVDVDEDAGVEDLQPR